MRYLVIIGLAELTTSPYKMNVTLVCWLPLATIIAPIIKITINPLHMTIFTTSSYASSRYLTMALHKSLTSRNEPLTSALETSAMFRNTPSSSLMQMIPATSELCLIRRFTNCCFSSTNLCMRRVRSYYGATFRVLLAIFVIF